MRAWKDKCQVIGREEEFALWQTREQVYSLPVDDRFQSLPIAGGSQPVRGLAMETRKMEEHWHGRELRDLLRGDLSFEGALNGQRERMIEELRERGSDLYGFKMLGGSVVIVGPGEPNIIGTPRTYAKEDLEAGVKDGVFVAAKWPNDQVVYMLDPAWNASSASTNV